MGKLLFMRYFIQGKNAARRRGKRRGSRGKRYLPLEIQPEKKNSLPKGEHSRVGGGVGFDSPRESFLGRGGRRPEGASIGKVSDKEILIEREGEVLRRTGVPKKSLIRSEEEGENFKVWSCIKGAITLKPF